MRKAAVPGAASGSHATRQCRDGRGRRRRAIAVAQSPTRRGLESRSANRHPRGGSTPLQAATARPPRSTSVRDRAGAARWMRRSAAASATMPAPSQGPGSSCIDRGRDAGFLNRKPRLEQASPQRFGILHRLAASLEMQSPLGKPTGFANRSFEIARRSGHRRLHRFEHGRRQTGPEDLAPYSTGIPAREDATPPPSQRGATSLRRRAAIGGIAEQRREQRRRLSLLSRAAAGRFVGTPRVPIEFEHAIGPDQSPLACRGPDRLLHGSADESRLPSSVGHRLAEPRRDRRAKPRRSRWQSFEEMPFGNRRGEVPGQSVLGDRCIAGRHKPVAAMLDEDRLAPACVRAELGSEHVLELAARREAPEPAGSGRLTPWIDQAPKRRRLGGDHRRSPLRGEIAANARPAGGGHLPRTVAPRGAGSRGGILLLAPERCRHRGERKPGLRSHRRGEAAGREAEADRACRGPSSSHRVDHAGIPRGDGHATVTV